MKDSEISLEMEFSIHDITIQSTLFQTPNYGESDDSGGQVPSMNPIFTFAPNAILIDLLHDKKLLLVNGIVTNTIPGW